MIFLVVVIFFVICYLTYFLYHVCRRCSKPRDILADRDSVFQFLQDKSLEDYTTKTLDEIQKISLSSIRGLLRESKDNSKGSRRWGNCKLHALDVKLLPLFSADIHESHINVQGRSSTRIIFYFKSDQLWFYGFLYNHQYALLRFIRKIGNHEDERGFLETFNEAKYSSQIIYHRFNNFKQLIDRDRDYYTEDIQEFLNAHSEKLKELLGSDT